MMNYTEIILEKSSLAKEILTRMYKDEWEDQERKEKALKDVEWTILYIVQSFMLEDKKILQNYFAWMKKLFITLKIDAEHLTILFETTKLVLEERYGGEVTSFLNSIKIEDSVYYPQLLLNNDLYSEMVSYRDFLLNAEKDKAKKVIDDLVENGISIEKIYVNVFQESLRYVGEYWLEGKISVAKEHYFTAMTQYIMSTLYNYIMILKRQRKF